MARFFQTFIISALIGLFGGLSSSVLLYSLDWATKYRQQYPYLIYLLPFAGLCIGAVYDFLGKESHGGTHLIIDEIQLNKKPIPTWMAPLILFGTFMTHLFGGSAGREGTAVQMSASLADRLYHIFKLKKNIDRKKILLSGISAGFGSSVGAPFAGAMFGIEMSTTGRWNYEALSESVISSFSALAVVRLLNTPHSQFYIDSISGDWFQNFWSVCVASLIFALATRFFIMTVHWLESIFKKLISSNIFRPFIGGILLIVLFQVIDPGTYAGLGLHQIQQSLINSTQFFVPFNKMIATLFTLSSGFKGGEFIPLVFVGTTLGSALASFLPASVSLMSSVGFVSVFGAASKTPMACTILAIEIFGIQIAPYAFVSCFLSYYFSGPKSIYKTQRSIQRT